MFTVLLSINFVLPNEYVLPVRANDVMTLVKQFFGLLFVLFSRWRF